jgi:GT2 family glycosyltransferase
MAGAALADVVIPSYNGVGLLRRCLHQLARDRAVGRVIVVDDASSDGTPSVVRAEFPHVTIIGLKAHRGLSHALNRGAAASDSEFVLFLNNDVLARDGAIGRLAAALRADPGAASAGGRLVESGSLRTQAAYQPRDLPGLAGLIARVGGVERLWPRNPWTGGYLRAPLTQSAPQRTRRQPAGACLMVRRCALRSIGGWDERYWVWYEDVDISRRLLAIGPALYVPSATFEHAGHASTGGWRKHEQRARLYHGTMVYAQAHLSSLRQVALGLALLGACLPRYLAALPLDPTTARSYGALTRAAFAVCALRPVPSPRFGFDRPRVTV